METIEKIMIISNNLNKGENSNNNINDRRDKNIILYLLKKYNH